MGKTQSDDIFSLIAYNSQLTENRLALPKRTRSEFIGIVVQFKYIRLLIPFNAKIRVLKVICRKTDDEMLSPIKQYHKKTSEIHSVNAN